MYNVHTNSSSHSSKADLIEHFLGWLPVQAVAAPQQIEVLAVAGDEGDLDIGTQAQAREHRYATALVLCTPSCTSPPSPHLGAACLTPHWPSWVEHGTNAFRAPCSNPARRAGCVSCASMFACPCYGTTLHALRLS